MYATVPSWVASSAGSWAGWLPSVCRSFRWATASINHAGVLLLIGFGIFFGIWSASLVGVSVPNSQLRRFADAIERGNVLLIADVPFGRVDEIQELLAQKHPEAKWEGVDPTVPAFP